jgi:hypothetical protein
MEHDRLKWWHQDVTPFNVIPGQPGDDYLMIECSDEDDYMSELIAQHDLMGVDVLGELGYTGTWL